MNGLHIENKTIKDCESTTEKIKVESNTKQEKQPDKISRIFVCGDTHGTLSVQKLDRLKASRGLSYADYLIICGDSGIVWSNETLPQHIRYYDQLNCTVLYIDGNHENFDMLKAYPVEIWRGGKIHKISEHIYHLLRGQVFDICGKKFLTIGGADSNDTQSRKEHISWWSDETISCEDINEAKRNLEKVGYEVDYILTHTPSTKTLKGFVEILTQCGEAVPLYLQHKIVPTQSSDMLSFVQNFVKFKKWFCGHIHVDEKVGKTQILYNDIITITCHSS